MGRPIGSPEPVPAVRRRKVAGKVALAALSCCWPSSPARWPASRWSTPSDLPQINDLEHYRPSTTTDLYDRKGRIIGSFALERRVVVNYDDFAPILRQAVISIEDKSFESHWGINVFRVAGALWHDLRSHGRAQGASTLTMQLARNLFLSSERTATRKLQEAYLAIQIERAFTKEQIFTLYGNQIYLGSGMYGFEAASEFYFSKHAKDLNLTEAALLAGLPKGPVAYSPLLNPEKALRRRNLVLSEMESDGVITHQQAEQARQAAARPAHLAAGAVRRALVPGRGAPRARKALRHGAGARGRPPRRDHARSRLCSRPPTAPWPTASPPTSAATAGRASWKTCSPAAQTIEEYKHPDWALASNPGDYVHAVVTSALPLEIHARVGAGEVVLLPEDWKWTGQRFGDALVKPGDIIYVHLSDGVEGNARRATLEQDSGAQGSLMAMDNTTGDVLAMVGGRDYALSQFNRATQAERQTGSSFKPYVYTTAIEDGAKPDDIIVDAPVSFGSYTPHNYENDYKGAMTLINAFAESRNIPAVKLAARVGIHKVIDMAHRFGVTSDIPAYLPVALGAAEITLQGAGGLLLRLSQRRHPRDAAPHPQSLELRRHHPVAGPARSQRVIAQQTARTMMMLLRAVTASWHRRRRRRSSTIRWAAKPAPPATSPTPGSSASRRRSPAACGSATTAASRWAKRRPAPAPPCPSG